MKPNGSFGQQQQPMQWYSGGMDYSQNMHYQQPMAASHHHYGSGFDDEPPLLEGGSTHAMASGWLSVALQRCLRLHPHMQKAPRQCDNRQVCVTQHSPPAARLWCAKQTGDSQQQWQPHN
jgi:hypothetical protein